MNDLMIDYAIQRLGDGESFIVPESDYGKAEIWKVRDRLLLFSIPTYGGIPSFEDIFKSDEISLIIKKISEWT